MLSGFSKISKSLHEHTIGSAINIPTRAYNVCADSDFVFDARPIAYPSFSPCQFSVHASLVLCIYIYVCICIYAVCSVFRLHYLFRAIAPSCLQEKFDTLSAGRFLFSRDFYALAPILQPPSPFFFRRRRLMVVSSVDPFCHLHAWLLFVAQLFV